MHTIYMKTIRQDDCFGELRPPRKNIIVTRVAGKKISARRNGHIRSIFAQRQCL